MDSGDLYCEKCGVEPGDTIPELKKVARLYVAAAKGKRSTEHEGFSALQIICFSCRDGLKQLYQDRGAKSLLERVEQAGVAQQRIIYKHLQEKFGK